MMRFMKASNMGTVNAVPPWFGRQTMPLLIRLLRVGAREDTFSFRQAAMSPEPGIVVNLEKLLI